MFQHKPDIRSNSLFAAHVQDQFTIMDNLIINAGIRYDHYRSFGDTVNPRIGLIYNPRPKTAIKLLYGQAFRAPNAYELYVNDGGHTSKSDHHLKPEKIRTFELIGEQYFKNYRVTLSGFYYHIRDLIGYTVDPRDGLYVYSNFSEVESKGAELEIQGKWAKNIDARLGYSYQETTDKETDKTLINSPKHLVKFNLSAPLIGDRLSSGLDIRYVGPRKSRMGEVGGAVIANLTLLSREIMPGVDISGSIYNIFDKKYSDPASSEFRAISIPQDGRTFRFKVDVRF